MPSKRAIINRTYICQVVFLSIGRNLCADLSELKQPPNIYTWTNIQAQKHIYSSLKGGKDKKKLDTITVQ